VEIIAQQGEYVLVRVEVKRQKSYGYVVRIDDPKNISRRICLDPAAGDPHWGEPSLTDYRKKKILQSVRAKVEVKSKEEVDAEFLEELEELEPEDGVFAYSPTKRKLQKPKKNR
jgi:hypothetical protein